MTPHILEQQRRRLRELRAARDALMDGAPCADLDDGDPLHPRTQAILVLATLIDTLELLTMPDPAPPSAAPAALLGVLCGAILTVSLLLITGAL